MPACVRVCVYVGVRLINRMLGWMNNYSTFRRFWIAFSLSARSSLSLLLWADHSDLLHSDSIPNILCNLIKFIYLFLNECIYSTTVDKMDAIAVPIMKAVPNSTNAQTQFFQILMP